ncbi:MAG: uncharacterized protein A8A55_0540 [Amphiamblys sp. WSBS2006]|nr:MAG: uncharacterized protein A8A55_0540 [Amphiamblys sp. WSBS2006]
MELLGTFFRDIVQNMKFYFSKQNKQEYAMAPAQGITAGVSILPDCSRKTMQRHYPESLKLRSVILIHRHGARTPIGTLSETDFGHFRWDFCRNVGTNLIKILEGLNNAPHENEDDAPMKPVHEKSASDESPFRIVFDKTKDHSPDEKLNPGAGNKKSPEVQFEIASKHDSCYLGQLTDIGYELMGALGKRLRELYVDKLGFLPTTYSPDAVHFHSTQYARTIESVHAVANSLYPNPETQHTIQTRSEKHETFYPSPGCARYREIRDAHIEKKIEEHKDTLDRIKGSVAKAIGVPKIEESFKRTWDVLHSRYAHGMDLPKGITPLFVKKMERLVCDVWLGFLKTDEEAFRLGSGRLMQQIAENIRKAHWAATTPETNQTTHPKETAGKLTVHAEAPPLLSILSGHDSTLCPLAINLLGIHTGNWPSFGSNITFELLSEKTKKAGEVFYVRTRYNDRFFVLPKSAGHEHPTDKTLCRMSRFLEICDDATPKNYEEECGPKNK